MNTPMINDDINQKYNLITRNLQEIIGETDLKEILKTRNPKIYWGTATTGKPHIAYLLPLLKIKDFINAGCHVKILLADVHAFLDNLKANFNQIKGRTKYYKILIIEILKMLGIENGYEIIQGSSFQTSPDYTMDLFKLCSLTTQRDAIKAGTTVVKQVDNPLISSLIYPSMQALDEEYLNVDAQFGGIDQRKIFMYAAKYLPKLKYKKRVHLMNTMIPGLNGDKMSASLENSKIDFLDSEKTINKKIKKCFCEEKNPNTGLLPFLEYILIPIYKIKKKEILIKRRDLESLKFSEYNELYDSFINGDLHPSDLKTFVSEAINFVIKPIRDVIEKETELIKEAYSSK